MAEQFAFVFNIFLSSQSLKPYVKFPH